MGNEMKTSNALTTILKLIKIAAANKQLQNGRINCYQGALIDAVTLRIQTIKLRRYASQNNKKRLYNNFKFRPLHPEISERLKGLNCNYKLSDQHLSDPCAPCYI